ncbi:hypothetical protein [Mycolicibacterium fluoranthenivorans]|uniref:Uncharacterized protein n=1 Tax=Mycolicibacterium fluoranthenivorans TaxID=258505 RepID=A0A7X5TYV2_9MYCO|nr:hypothetical protein [Mycolicibacterium fluoranthenivorans]MCV7357326.1 hypothetical protein [Mycolicibacterium fluoranthenivorans]NIH95295.1 hypothetical protein [Mycolicibacterium fluoranthenivorans]
MDRAKRAVAASATALAALVLVGGPSATVAAAAPGDSSHSHGGQHGNRGGGHGGERGPRNVSGYGRAADTATVSRAPQTAASTGDSERSTAAPTPSIAGARSSSGSDMPPAAPAFVAPEVTFGDGRTPGDGARQPVVSAPQPGVAIALPPVVMAVPAPLGIAPAPAPPSAPLDLSALHGWDSARPGQPMTSWFGLAGLLLIPLAGAALGYRQARAAKAASNLAIR